MPLINSHEFNFPKLVERRRNGHEISPDREFTHLIFQKVVEPLSPVVEPPPEARYEMPRPRPRVRIERTAGTRFTPEE